MSGYSLLKYGKMSESMNVYVMKTNTNFRGDGSILSEANGYRKAGPTGAHSKKFPDIILHKHMIMSAM